MPDLYDLFWVYPPPPVRVVRMQLAQNGVLGNVKNQDAIPGAILYPALCTPEIVWGNEEKVELLMAFRGAFDEKILPNCVNLQLKVCRGLNPEKPYTDETLADDPTVIKVDKVEGGLTPAPLFTHKRFRGLLHKTAVDFYTNKGFTRVYRISFPSTLLRRPPKPSLLLQYRQKSTPVKSTMTLRPGGPRIESLDQDFHVYEEVKDTRASEMKCGQYGFMVGDEDVSIGEINPDNPVQTFHPVFYYPELEAINIGHMSDIHLNSRQQVLSHSPASLVEHPNFREPIGPYVNIASHNAKLLLNEFRDDPEIGAVVLTGDIIDYVENVWDSEMGADKTTAKGIRDLVDLKEIKGPAYTKRYKSNVDFLVFYSLVTDFYQKGGKPVYAVTGNHDCYKEAQGIFPMLGGTTQETDKNMPANHNLTIYEACTIFGESFHRLGHHNKAGVAGTGFNPKCLGWIYKVLTPFCDFAVQTPKQVLVGLGWGEHEVIFPDGKLNTLYGQGLAALPLSDRCVSNTQLALIEAASSDGKKMVLFSHFTFVSFMNTISEEDMEGDSIHDPWRMVSVDTKGTQSIFNSYEMGTFEQHRKELYVEWLAGGKIDCILTGHTHRRAMYTLERDRKTLEAEKKQGAARFYIPTRFHPLKPMPERGTIDPGVHPIIVCDASGSLTRRNRKGEFAQFGNSQCSGVKVHFSDEGHVDWLNYIPVGKKPRFAVAMSYYSFKKEAFIGSLETPWFTKGDHESGTAAYRFTLRSDWLARWSKFVSVEWMRLYWKDGGQWKDLELASSKPNAPGLIFEPSPQHGLNKMLESAKASKDTLFLSVKFDPAPNAPEPTFDGYDFDSPWTFPAKLTMLPQSKDPKSKVKYVIEPLDKERPQHWSDT